MAADLDFFVGWPFSFFSGVSAVFFAVVSAALAGAAALFATGLVLVAGGGVIFFAAPALLVSSPLVAGLLDGLASMVLGDDDGEACFDFNPEVMAAVGSEDSLFDFAPLETVLLSDLAGTTGFAGGGGGGGAFGLLVIPNSLKTATTEGFLWLAA